MATRAVGLLLTAGLTACSGWGGGLGDAGRWLTAGQPVEVHERRRALYCDSRGPETRLQLFDSADQFLTWADARGLQLAGEAELPPGRYAFIELGERPTGGYGLAVSRVAARSGATLRLRASFIEPAPDAMVTQALTAPCSLVHLPELPFSVVELEDQDGRRRASSREPRA